LPLQGEVREAARLGIEQGADRGALQHIGMVSERTPGARVGTVRVVVSHGIASVPSPAQTLSRGHREIKRTARSRKLPPRRGVKRQAGRQTVRSGETFTRSLL